MLKTCICTENVRIPSEGESSSFEQKRGTIIENEADC